MKTIDIRKILLQLDIPFEWYELFLQESGTAMVSLKSTNSTGDAVIGSARACIPMHRKLREEPTPDL
ncbi:hypothetical protein J2TS4_07760 [Paenibacillus sp. J2TS4]|nr:hypothetical protein J2TS4_07760 [Paenibacillus sp. J2TS4]